MLYRSLGKTGLRVSEIGFGCASYWGMKLSMRLLRSSWFTRRSITAVTFFDTGASYSGGNAEPRLGKALAGLNNKHELVIATKAGTYTDDQGKRRADFSALGVRRTVEASLPGLDWMRYRCCIFMVLKSPTSPMICSTP